jgi:hypothetical protein
MKYKSSESSALCAIWRVIFGLSTLVWLTSGLEAKIINPNGAINFDVNRDGTTEMTLTTIGLGIGVATPSANLEVSGNTIITGALQIGSWSSSDNLSVGGTIAFSPLTYSQSGNISNTSFVLVDTSANNITLTLPYASNVTGQIITIKQTNVTHDLFLVNSGNYINSFSVLQMNGASSYLGSISLISDGRNWISLSEYGSITEMSSSNLLLYWKLDETNGSSAQDSSSNGYLGTLVNGHSFTGNSLSGAIASSLKLDDIDDRLKNPSVPTSYGQYSYSFWFRPNVNDSTEAHFEGNVEGVLGFSWASSNTIWNKACYQQLNDNSYVQAKIGSTMSANTWHHVVGSWDGSNLRAYLNGSLEATTATASLKVPSGNLELMAPQTQCIAPDFRLDDFRFYTKALSSDEISALYQAGSP